MRCDLLREILKRAKACTRADQACDLVYWINNTSDADAAWRSWRCEHHHYSGHGALNCCPECAKAPPETRMEAESGSICPKCFGGGIASNEAGEYTCRRCLGHGRISDRELESWTGELARLRRIESAAREYTLGAGDVLIGALEDALEPPYVCPGCHAVGGERCAHGCFEAEAEEEREDEYQRGGYEPETEDGE